MDGSYANPAAVLPQIDAEAAPMDVAPITAKHNNWQSLQVLDDVPATMTLATKPPHDLFERNKDITI